MNDTRGMLLETSERLFRDLCTRGVIDEAERGEWPAALWTALEETGITSAATPEARGGPGLAGAEMFALLKLAGVWAVPVPLAETLLAEQMLAAAGLPPLTGAATVGPVLDGNRIAIERRAGKWKLSGTLHRLPWARHAVHAVVLAEYDNRTVTVIVERPRVDTAGANQAREPRDTLRFDAVELVDAAVGAPDVGFSYDDLYARGALCRTVAMAGALEKVLGLTVSYAKERVQFGRAIGKFQAVQQQIAVMASHVAASSAAAHAAVAALESGPALFEIGAAKTRVGEAAGIVAAIAHQVHGAIGFTHEHELHHSTRRLWAWRDEFGSETQWATRVGKAVVAMGGEALWPFITARRCAASAA